MKKTKVRISIFLLFVVILIGILFLNMSNNIFYKSFYPKSYSQYVEKYSQKYNVDKNLVFAIIKCESNFKQSATSKDGAIGLMQIMDDTFVWAKTKKNDKSNTVYEDLYGVEKNIDYGTFIISELLVEFKTLDNALCAYHAGWGSAKQWLKKENYSPDGQNIINIPFNDTKYYVSKVTQTYNIYKKLYKEKEV